MSNPTYQIMSRDKEGNILGEFTQFQSLRFSGRHNNFGQCSFQVPVDSDELRALVSMRRYETLILRNGTIVWSGEQANRETRLQANSANLTTVVSYEFFEMLNSFYTDPFIRYQETDQGEILKDLVDTRQLEDFGDAGFTFSSITPTKDRDREYNNYNIMDAYINMSNVIDGPDFWIDEDKVIHIVPFRGIDKSTQTIFEYGTNILNCQISEDFSSPGNQAIMLGSGFGSEQTVVVVDESASQGIYGLRQQVQAEVDVSEDDNLADKGLALIRKHRSPILSISFTQIPNTLPVFNTAGIGDSVRIKVNNGIYDINNIFRIYGYDVEIGDNGEEYISYLVGQI